MLSASIFTLLLICTGALGSMDKPLAMNNSTARSKRGDPNGYDLPHHIQCPTGEALYKLRSSHSNSREDRYFDYSCRRVSDHASGCFWSGYVNSFDWPVSFMCPANYYLAGTSSYHDNGREDRRFKFYCCKSSPLKTHECFITGFLNGFDHHVSYTSATGSVFTGMTSEHHNHHE